jgi:putative serine protease PepD
LVKVNADEGFDDDGPFASWVAPDDRLWRHPSEVAPGAPAGHFAPSSGLRGDGPRTWTTALVAGVVGALLASGIGVAGGAFSRTTVVHTFASPATPSTTLTRTVAVPATDWTSVNDELDPSMVTVTGNGDAGEVSTSGMLWEPGWDTAYILAASENLDGVSSVNVAFAGGLTSRGRVIGTDPQTGIAVISVGDKTPFAGASLSFPQLGSLTDVSVGASLATVGPGAEAQGSFVPGAVSSLDRPVTDSSSGLVMLGMIAVATAGPVNYGTAVVDTNGDVVGLTVEQGSSDTNTALISYAVPMDVATGIATQIVDGRRPWHPWIGILQAEDLPPITASEMNLPGGAQIDAISPGSPAAEAGLRLNDVIVDLANTPIVSTGGLLDALNDCNSNARVSLRYIHQGKPVTTSIQITAQPTNP